MLRQSCPWCGERDYTEFAYGGDATVRRPLKDAPLAEWMTYVYWRANPRGPHEELWHHVFGCRQWIRVARDTVTHRITSVRGAHQQGFVE
jgi:heterotetrameric sarcosine oxidase delta subunit